MDENGRITRRADDRRRSHLFILIGLFIVGMPALGIGGAVLRIRATRERDRAMSQLRQTADGVAALACTDPLTGLRNQREFHAVLARELALLDEGESDALGLVLIDVDNFKSINDARGHLVGAHVLIEIARRLDAHAAPAILHSARVGGEEFAVILPRSRRDRSLRFAEQFRAAVEVPILPVGIMTVSIGVAVTTSAQESHNLFCQADVALYAAKRAGKNRVVFADGRMHRDRVRTAVEANSTFDALRALVSTVDNSPSIDGHSERVARFAARLARQAGWSPADVARLRQAALLHDVGKVVVPPGILLKPGGLTDGERSLVSVHPAVGSEMVRRALDSDQASWVLCHQERWDGGGYPNGLAGEDIPEGARILAIADAWDAMTCERVFAPALDVTAAIAELSACRGSQFWPRGIDLMIEATLNGAAEPSLA